MSILKAFSGFVGRVIKAAKGRLSSSDMLLLKHLLNRTSERNLILSRGLLTALNIHSPKKRDIESLAKMLDNANLRILKNKKPFTAQEEKTLSKLFEKYGLSPKVAMWMTAQRDAFLYYEITRMANKTTLKTPKIKTVFMKRKGKKKRKQKLT